MRSVQVCFVVFFMPIMPGIKRFTIASSSPERMKARSRSIQKLNTAGNPEAPCSGLYQRKNMECDGGLRCLALKKSASMVPKTIRRNHPKARLMHMSLAFGWFLLIVFGTIEADFFSARHLNPPSHAIFFRWYNPEHGASGFPAVFSFWMDLLLAFILSGLLLAMVKRFIPGMMGMKKTTKHTWTDRLTLLR